ncbi:PE-PGRS family protein [Streptomyces sp. NPDC001381]|uniref:PE-PGRS family protein n=1 Tax=Streptomyces sp. NPDC001381 TaxID=3364567 RepID=UPI0036BF7C4D
MHAQRQHGDGEQRRPGVPARTVPVARGTAGAGRDGDGPAGLLALQRAAGNRAVTATVQRMLREETEAGAPAGARTPPADEAALRVSTDPDAVIVRLSASLEEHAIQKKRKFNFWEPHKKWPEDWLPDKHRLRWVLERRLVLGEIFRPEELRDIEVLSERRPAWLNSVGIGTRAEGERIAAGTKGSQEHADYSDWLRLSPGRRVLAATIAFQTQRPGRGDPVPNNPAYTLGRFMRAQGLPPDHPERLALEAERDEQIRETAVDTLFPEGVRDDQRHESAADHATEDMKAKDAFARTILTNVLLVLRHGLQYARKDGHVDYREGDVVRALAHGGRVNIRVPALRDGESPHQLLDFLGATRNGVPHEQAVHRGFATHRSSIGRNRDGEPGRFEEKGGVGASLTNMASTFLPGVATPLMLAADLAGGGFGTRDWNGDVVLPNGSYGHMLLVFAAPTADKDGSLLVGIETIAPHAASPVGYHHGIRSTEATANPESVLHGHKQDKIGTGKMKANQRLVDLGRTGGENWHTFLEQLRHDWLAELESAKNTAEKRKLYGELVGPRK